jgi:methylthioribose-1-phosphate isomerase
MKVQGRPTRTIRLAEDGWVVEIIDQTRLPHDFVTCRLETLEDAAHRAADRGDRRLRPGAGPAHRPLR